MPSILELRQKEFSLRFLKLPFAQKQSLVLKSSPPSNPLHIVYLLNHTGVCGGVKVILEHAHYLTLLGFKVTLISHFPRPTWFSFQADYLQIPFDLDLARGIPPCDLIIATYWDHIQACIDTHIAPVIYFEQGDYHLFERDTINLATLHFIDVQFTLPHFIMTVSNQTAHIIHQLYHREAKVFPNAVNPAVFNLSVPRYQHPHPYFLMMGSDESHFKGLNEIFEAYNLIRPSFPFIDLIWITPTPPASSYPASVKVIENPPQQLIGSLYRGAAAFISASHYEAFSLPVLEAMSCGCPVITTNNSGVLEYAVDSFNCLFTPINNSSMLAQNMLKLLYVSGLQKQIVQGGLQTAQRYSWPYTISRLASFYHEAAAYADTLSPIK